MRFAHFEFEPSTDKLGDGPQSEVYRAVDTRLGRTVALKILRAHVEIDPAADDRFLREARQASNLKHENIAVVYEYGRDQGTSYIAMEYLEGRTLDKILKEQMLGIEEGVRIALAVSSALAHVHEKGVIHRDLKPGNIMVLADGGVKLLDFGIARAKDEVRITQVGMLVGTVLYMAPEQVRGQDITTATDVFSLGAVLYHAWTGLLPFAGRSFPEVYMAILEANPRRPSEARPGLPAPLEGFLLQCMAPEPAARFPDARTAHAALSAAADRVLGGEAASVTNLGRLHLGAVELDAGRGSHADALASGLRSDLVTELERVKGLQLARDTNECDHILTIQLRLSVGAATAEWHLDTRGQVKSERHSERVEYTSDDEWELQAGLGRAIVRGVRRKLGELALLPKPAATRDTEASQRHARHAHDLLHRGTTKHLMAAISSFRRALEADPRSALACAGMAEALVRKFLYWDGDTTFLDEARDYAARALRLDPRCAEAHTSLGFAWHLSGHPADAEREYRVAIELDHKEWLAHRLLGALLLRRGNVKSAASFLRVAIALRPAHIGSYDHLWSALQRLDRYEEAIETADEGIAAAKKHLAQVPDDQEARLHMALLQARIGAFDAAREAIRQARILHPKDGYTSFQAAVALSVAGDLPEAVEALAQAQARGYWIRSELISNTDLDVLRGLTDFQKLLN